jgi:GAG-pre-integrase domain/Integrase core domain
VSYPVEGAGDVSVLDNITLKNTLFVPSLSTKLISIGQLTEEQNCVALMFSNYIIFQDILTKEVISHGTKRDGLYYLDEVKIGRTHISSTKPSNSREKIMLWHKRLGHLSFGYLKKLSPHLFDGLENEQFVCETCIKAKSHRTSYFESDKRSLIPFNLIHTYVWGPSPVVSKSGCRWFTTFTDDCTCMTWVYLLKTKDEVTNVFQIFFTMVQNQFEKRIKILRSDNETEYINKNLQVFLKEHGI